METINHEYYVSTEVAKLLRDAGYEWRCKTYYDTSIYLDETIIEDEPHDYNFMNGGIRFSAPTLDVAQRWLREVKNLILLIEITPSYCNEKPMGYKFVIHISCGNHIYGEWKDTYEEAQEAGIKKALEIILEKGGKIMKNVVFSNNGKTSERCPRDFEGTFIIPNGVTTIEDCAFHGCTSLTSVTIPDSVTIIGHYAFEGCTGLASVTIPDSVTSIGEFAFSGCRGLASVVIPDSVTYIGNSTFENCTSLTSVVIPNSVTFIGNSAFENCTSLASVVIPNSVTNIDSCAFYGCTSLTSVVIPNSVTFIGNSAFENCTGLTSITIPDSVTFIGVAAFHNCTRLASMTSDKATVAYKGFHSNMKCRGFQYEEDKTFYFDGTPKLCQQGFHACLNVLDVFTYYFGKLGKDFVIHEVKIGKIYGKDSNDSKIVTDEITIGRRLTFDDINRIINKCH